MNPLYRAWLAILQAQSQLDPQSHMAVGDTWAVLDSQKTTLQLWMEEERDEED